MTELVRAAGGLVFRRDGDRPVELAVIHRPKYNDWTFPKGKLQAGESFEEAALREVEEESGYRCRLEREVGSVEYVDRHGRPKVVRYWAMTPLSGTFTPGREVDELRWVDIHHAASLLSYQHDRDLVGRVEVGA